MQSVASASPGGAWFAVRGATDQARASQRTVMPGIPSTVRQQQQARAKLQRSVGNLGRTAAAIAAAQAAQEAARAAGQVDRHIPEGYAEGGLWDRDAQGNLHAWSGADRAVHSVDNGKHKVAIRQTDSRAVLNWETFNVGRDTTVDFDQQSTDAVLNRVVGADTRPSQIQGAINGKGTVMVVNQNGVVFSGGSQVNVRNLVAAAAQITDAQFRDRGLYGADANTATFTEAAGKITVQPGARIATHVPGSATQGGGYVLLAGTEVRNAGQITTPNGQTALAAGDEFVIVRGQGTSGNPNSTTRGNEVAARLSSESLADPARATGAVTNTGLIAAATGDITLTGRDVTQAGVAVATTSTSARGTIHLDATRAGGAGRVTLASNSVTAVVLDASSPTALDSQRDAGNVNPDSDAEGSYSVDDQRYLSRIEIDSDHTVEFQGEGPDRSGSLALATGGQLVVNAAHRALVDTGAELDVSGAVGVRVAMESNNLEINVQGNEQRDAPVNRDSANLNSSNIWVDRRTLVYVPAGTNGYESDRWYTAGGLLEVSGYLATSGRTVGEWMAQGGVVSFGGGDVVTRAGSNINLSGGTLDVQAGFIRQSWLRGDDGRLYEVSKAPADVLYRGLYRGYERDSARWGVTDLHYSPLVGPGQRYEPGYTVGRDAGKLVIATQNAVLEGDVTSEVYQGPRQVQKAQLGLDGYHQSQTAAARRGHLLIGRYRPMFSEDSEPLGYNLDPIAKDVLIGDVTEIAKEIALDDPIAPGREGTLAIDADRINGWRLDGLDVAAAGQIDVLQDVAVSDGGRIALQAPGVDVAANLTAQSGQIVLGNVQRSIEVAGVRDTIIPGSDGQPEFVRIGAGVVLDVSGAWRNVASDPQAELAWPYVDGGSVAVRTSGGIAMEAGSLIDATSGAVLGPDASLTGGRGGDVTLETLSSTQAAGVSRMVLNGEVAGYGVEGAGTLALIDGGKVVIGDAAGAAPEFAEAATVLSADVFQSGFSNYVVTGGEGLLVAEGTQLDVSMPVLRGSDDRQAGSAEAGLERWLPPLYHEDPRNARMTQRQGASLTLNAGTVATTAAQRNAVLAHLAPGSRITVDPGQSVAIVTAGNLTVDGTVTARGGRISLSELAPIGDDDLAGEGQAHRRTLRVNGTLDVSGGAATAVAADGRRYGTLYDAGKIQIGGLVDEALGTTLAETSTFDRATAPYAFVVVDEAAVLDARGASAEFDVPGTGRQVLHSDGGHISLTSGSGLAIDGQLALQAGGAGASGGWLSLGLESPYYLTEAGISDEVFVPREFVIGRHQSPPEAPAYGRARFSVQQLEASGADNLTVYSQGLISFEDSVQLRAGQSIRLYAGSLALADAAGADTVVQLAAPYVRLAGATLGTGSDRYSRVRVEGGRSQQDDEARFEVTAQLVDVRDLVTFGARSSYTMPSGGPQVTVDRRGFADVHLASGGDLRFLGGREQRGGGAVTTVLRAPRKLVLSAAQVYPATGAVARVAVGAANAVAGGENAFDPDSLLTITRPAGWDPLVLPQTPYSAFGALELGAATVEQAGVVRAPLGLITVGTNDSQIGRTSLVRMAPGSVTSVSGAGLVMPYGGTVDGITYQYGGNDVGLIGIGGTVGSSLRTGLTVAGKQIDIQPGALLDLSGGGELQGAGFISGRGGSTDARFHPLVRTTQDGFVLPGLSDNPVYAIVPAGQAAYAPVAAEAGASDPLVGQTITLGEGVPGLQAGVYTLLPSTYALLPGAYRVELNGAAPGGMGTGSAMALRNGSWLAAGQLGIANTAVRDTVARNVLITPADTLRRYSQYDETSYADFIVESSRSTGVPRAMLPGDARALQLGFIRAAGDEVSDTVLRFEGTADFSRDDHGYGNGVYIVSTGVGLGLGGVQFEIVGDRGVPTLDAPEVVSIRASQLNAIDADRIVIGGLINNSYGQGGNLLGLQAGTSQVTVRQGAYLSAPEVMLLANRQDLGGIVVEAGAEINTIGQGSVAFDSSDGFTYRPNQTSILALSNGWLDMLPPEQSTSPTPIGGVIEVGACPATGNCNAPTRLYSSGTITIATVKPIELADTVRYGTRNLVLAVGGFNVGSEAALAAAAERNALRPGVTLNQDVMERLLSGDQEYGAPALEGLFLTARESFNFYGSVVLDTLDPATGVSRLQDLVLTTPAIYGHGSQGDVAVVQTGNLIWNGSTTAAPAPVLQGPGQGSGELRIEAERIEFGYGARSRANTLASHERLILGFSDVTLAATDRVTANRQGSLSVYQSRGAYDAQDGFQYAGGNLHIATPMLTTEAGAQLNVEVGEALVMDGRQAADAPDVTTLGGTLALRARSIVLDTAVALPSGRFELTAQDGISLGDGALIDVSGRAVAMADATRYSWGGDVVLESSSGNIVQAAGSIIDLSAEHNNGGRLSAIALADEAGLVQLQGQILGSASGYYDAGGTLVPYLAAGVAVRAQRLGAGSLDTEFAALNQRLNDGGVFGSRSFQLKQGSLAIGDGVRANAVDISVDGGSLTVAGTIDASGERVGTIRLAGKQGLTIAGTALLDAHGSMLRVDSHGRIIDAPNRALIELNSGDGVLTLAGGARMDLRHGTAAPVGDGTGQHDGAPRGTVELTAPRLGAADLAIDARGTVDVAGAKAISLNANRRYDDPLEGTPDHDEYMHDGDGAASGRPYREIDQAYLDALHADSTAFMDLALANIRGGGALAQKMSGLLAHADTFHLRPSVEIVSQGDIVVDGDLDLSGYRYDSLNPHVRAFVAGSRPDDTAYGAGEVGRLVVRAAGDLSIHGSVTDGFLPIDTEVDTQGWILQEGVQPMDSDVVIPRLGIALQPDTTFPQGSTLNYDLPVRDMSLPAGTLVPVSVELASAIGVPAGVVLPGDVVAIHSDGSTAVIPAGQPFTAGWSLAAGTQLPAGSALPIAVPVRNLVWPKGVPLPAVMTLNSVLNLKVGALLPSGANLRLGLPAGEETIMLRSTEARNWSVAPLLPSGSQSWGLRLVAGADQGAADTRMVGATPGAVGNLILADSHYSTVTQEGEQGERVATVWTSAATGRVPGTEVPAAQMSFCTIFPTWCTTATIIINEPDQTFYASKGFSVIRTGTGDLDLSARRDVTMLSPFGVYTAGTEIDDEQFSSSEFYRERGATGGDGSILGRAAGDLAALVDGGADSLYRAWFPDKGGNVSISAGGDLLGEAWSGNPNSSGRQQLTSASVGNWLWRQGTGVGSAAAYIPTAWWINFGTYTTEPYLTDTSAAGDRMRPFLTGFTGVGALGGGNVHIDVRGNAGKVNAAAQDAVRSDALVVAVGSTGRILANGEARFTGGGDIAMRIGGDLNALTEGNAAIPSGTRLNHRINGSVINLRGSVQAIAASMGAVDLAYGNVGGFHDEREVRPYDPYHATLSRSVAGTIFVPGDATFHFGSRGDLVLGGVGDPGRAPLRSAVPFEVGGDILAGGLSSFSLWTDRTAINLFAAGGNMAVATAVGERGSANSDPIRGLDYSPTDGRYVFPSRLSAVAAGGSIFLGGSATRGDGSPEYSLLLAPNRTGSGVLDVLAADSIYAGGYSLNRSGASPDSTSDPWRPAFVGMTGITATATTNYAASGILPEVIRFPLLAFGPQTNVVTADHPLAPSRFYAVNGDIVGLSTGQALHFGTDSERNGQVWYEAAAPVRMISGGDIVRSGTMIGELGSVPSVIGGGNTGNAGNATGNLIVHSHPNDVSVVQAGGDIIYSSFQVAGPGVLEISAAGDIRMDDRVTVTSLGPIVPGDARPGASIVMQAGMPSPGGSVESFLARYIDPANLAMPGLPLADQEGKVAKTYVEELAQWLGERYGFEGTDEDAREYLGTLAPEQQRIFARQIYFAELREGGREYNDADGPRFGSYLRGRQAIAELFPASDSAGNEIGYAGDITLYGGAGVRTLVGGDIQLLTPGGAQTFGLEGEAPPSTAGIITQGQGNIQLYSLENILMGQSRIMTTFGGDILAWSAEGDINAGRGSSTTVVFTPPRRVYDDLGNVTLSSDVPSTGAGIATLAPIAEVPAGAIDLIAPLGTIDAGEAGIRSSGSVNIAALQVVNAANIQAQGEAVGIPVVAAVNVGALTSASNAASSAASSAQEAVQRSRAQQRQNLPSIINVQILGFGDEGSGGGGGVSQAPAPVRQIQARAPAYDPASPLQMVGNGDQFDAGQLARLTPEERRLLQQNP